MKGEKLSADEEAAEVFCQAFKMFLQENGLDLDNTYSGDETGLGWKVLPEKSLVARSEKESPGWKKIKQRVTILTCANATGTHRLPLLVIGKSKKPRCFRGVQQLPVDYTNQSSSWMDQKIFLEWYKSFVQRVKERKPSPDERYGYVCNF